MTKPLPYALILRKVKRGMRARNNFIYPKSGKVSCPDWDPQPRCGGGLHGYLWGKGDPSDNMPNSTKQDMRGKWLVIKTIAKNVVAIPEHYRRRVNKWKFKTGTVVFCGNLSDAADFIAKDPTRPRGTSAEKICSKFYEYA